MSTLNSIQYRSYSNAQQLARFLRKSKRIYATVTPFRNEVEALFHNLGEISAHATIKAKRGTMLTAQKRELKKEIAREAAGICSLATAYAIEKNDGTLLSHVNCSYTDIYTTKDIILQARVTIIINGISPHLDKADFKEYGITTTGLASICEKAKQFMSRIGTGKSLNWQSDNASRNITATLKKVRANILQMNRLLLLFKEKHPGFVEGFQQACTAQQKNKTHNAIKGIVNDTNTGQPVPGVTITAEGKNKTALTNAAGFYHLRGIKATTHTLTITAEGYTPQTVSVKVVRGKTTTLNITLETAHLNLSKTAVA